MNWSPQQYALAKHLGLTVWFKREALWMIKPARVFAKLGIILALELATKEEHTLLQKMLSILSLEASSYWIGWFDEAQLGGGLTAEHLVSQYRKWRPSALLGMGASLREIVKQQPAYSAQKVQITTTYHPHELIENTSLKKKTYQDLLHLKETLDLIEEE